MLRIVFVCMGNLCRSPTAEGVFRKMVMSAGCESEFQIDSAGTHDYHTGSPPDARAQEHAARRGYDLSAQRARQVRLTDFTESDLVLVMDRINLQTLERVCPPEHRHKLKLFLTYAKERREDEVPDPYNGGDQGFERVLDLVEDAARGLLRELRPRLRSAN